MPRKFPVSRAEELLKPSLDASVDPQALIAILPLRNEQQVADVGCGPGYFAIPLAKYLYKGCLYAVDVQEKMLEIVQRQAKKNRLQGVKTVLSKENSIPLEDALMDGVLCAGVLHEASKPNSLFKEMTRLLKPTGWLAILEWRPMEEPQVGPPTKVRIEPQRVRELGDSTGLKLVWERSLNPDRYVTLFRKPTQSVKV